MPPPTATVRAARYGPRMDRRHGSAEIGRFGRQLASSVRRGRCSPPRTVSSSLPRHPLLALHRAAVQNDPVASVFTSPLPRDPVWPTHTAPRHPTRPPPVTTCWRRSVTRSSVRIARSPRRSACAASPTPTTRHRAGRCRSSRISSATRSSRSTPTPTPRPRAPACRPPTSARTPAGSSSGWSAATIATW